MSELIWAAPDTIPPPTFSVTCEADINPCPCQDPLIPAAVRALTVAISASSESINAPAEVTLDVFAVNLASFAATLVLNEALAAVNEPLISEDICAELLKILAALITEVTAASV